MTSLDAFQRTVARALTTLAIIHVPILALIAWALQRPVWATAAIAALLAAAPVVVVMLRRPMIVLAFALVVALVGQTSLLVFDFEGHPWQIEMHFYYFAVLAMLSGFCDWRVLIVAAALVAVHHLSLNMFLPEAVYAGGTNFLRVVVHAVVVVIETAMLIGIRTRHSVGLRAGPGGAPRSGTGGGCARAGRRPTRKRARGDDRACRPDERFA